MRISRRALLAGVPVLASGQRDPPRTPSRSLRARLRAAFDKLELFDSHEHFWDERQRTAGPLDFFSLANDYVISDLVSAGLTPEAARVVRDVNTREGERWRAFEPFWGYVRYTGHGQALRIAIRELFGVSTIDERTLPKINAALQETNRPGVHERLLRRARISACVQDDYWHDAPVQAESARYVLARRFDRFIIPSTLTDIRALEKLTDSSITTLAGTSGRV